ncbi:hypothetical protein [Mycolicibacterium goodii]|uniref:Peptidase C39-like domain-containing protein n=1 Tax=Mycolicibacterium goodii TaxID=134601 RepID=A0A0K0X1I6_MYCGD|nr:hypothetical protein AFA91_04785 [Mycolicibacterium goodii]
MEPQRIAALRLRQRDGITCGPTVAVVAGVMLDPAQREKLLGSHGSQWFSAEQARVHADINAIWPRRLGTTPAGMARALGEHSASAGFGYRWRTFRGASDPLTDVLGAAARGLPVAMLVGARGIPRHWVLIVGVAGERMQCYEPSSGRVVGVPVDDIRGARLTGVGFRRPFAFVVPDR